MLKTHKLFITVIFFSNFFAANLGADQMLIDDFTSEENSRWSYISDQVMGGVSEGSMVFSRDKTDSFARLTGKVSTQNNGGFIQFRTSISSIDNKNIEGIYLKVRGNNQSYFVHLRTSSTIMPWQYYQAEFAASNTWHTFEIPLENFSASSGWLFKKVTVASIKSLGIVAFGRDHTADIQVAEVGFY